MMASPKGLSKSLDAFAEDAKKVVASTQAPSSEADQTVASSSTDCTPSPTSPTPGEESEENKAYVRGYNDALKDIPPEHTDSPATVFKDHESETTTENDASLRTELGDSASEDRNRECICGHRHEERESVAIQAGTGIQDDEQPNLLDAIKNWPDDWLQMVLVLLRRLSSDVFAVGYTPRGLPITNRDMKFAIMDELDRRIDMEEPQEQSDARAASGQDSRTSREVPDKGKGRDDGEEDVDSSPISPGEYKRLITVVTNNIVEAISLPIPLEDIPCRGRPRASLADIREAIRTVLIQRGLRELGEDVVCTLAGKDRMGIDEGDLTPSLKVSYEVIYDQEVATMVWVLNHPIPIPGISLPADEVRERLLLEFRLRCWRHAPSQMRARWEDDPEDVYEQRTCEVVVESLGGRPAPDLSHRDSSRMSDASKHERRADERLPIQLRCFRPWTRKGENGILGRQRFSRLRETTSRLWDEQSDLLSQDLTPRLGDLRPRARNLDDRSLSDGDEDRASELGSPFYPSASRASDDFHERKREQDIPRFGLGLGLGRRGLSLSSLRDDRQERESRDASRDQGFEGQRFGGGLGSRLKSRSRDDGFSDAQESRRLRSSGSFGHDSVAQAIRGWGTSGSLDSEWRRRSFGDGSAAQPVRGWGTDGGLRSRLRSRSRDNDFSDAQEPRRLRFGGDLGSGWGRRTVWEDYADAQGRLETFSPRDRERYNDLMDRWWGCGC